MPRIQREPREIVTIRGVVTAAESDDGDNVVAVTITTDDDEEIPVAPHGAGEDLLDLLDEYVEVTGFLVDDGDDEQLVVRRVRVVDDRDGDGGEGRSTDDDDEYERIAG